eukprot:CAMPEP_0202364058 /NCGR_PEP_ID=MMETSP1126-20121109/15605_1 /ASSEMBLY_ACC=CAM_ASM_000457 /TAXON_ID=3047 /ORGANISM="Dunaliella tertiolecta, Strain CCMP1320" /LENGTH=82 /DNA_ID=CAMNT_0048958599 /DNA_START=213 /DNA_END=462 /DNA_ORIENTATION=-
MALLYALDGGVQQVQRQLRAEKHRQTGIASGETTASMGADIAAPPSLLSPSVAKPPLLLQMVELCTREELLLCNKEELQSSG